MIGARRTVVIAAGAGVTALTVLAGLLIWVLSPSPPAGPSDPSNPDAGALGAAPSSSLGASPSRPAQGGPVVVSAASTSSPAPIGELVASYEVTHGLLADEIRVTIANLGPAPASWGSVTLTLSGVNLAVSAGSGVIFEVRGKLYVMTPGPGGGEVPAGGSTEFVLSVAGVLGSVDGCALDGRACKT